MNEPEPEAEPWHHAGQTDRMDRPHKPQLFMNNCCSSNTNILVLLHHSGILRHFKYIFDEIVRYLEILFYTLKKHLNIVLGVVSCWFQIQ